MKSGGYTITNSINGVTMTAGACRDFRVGSVSGLNVVGTEYVSLTGAVKITKTKKEPNTANNKMTRYLSLTSASTYTPPTNPNPWTSWNNYPTYGSPDFTVNNVRFERSISVYRDSGTTTLYDAFAADVCNYGDSVSFSRDFRVTISTNGRTEYINYRPSYNYSTTWNRNECRTFGAEVSKFSIWNSNNSYSVTVEANTGYDRISETNTYNNSLQSYVWTNTNGG